MQQANDIIIDIETLSTRRKAVIASICARHCDIVSGVTHKVLHLKLDVQAQIDAGYIVDASTLAFWLGQGADARKYLTDILARKVDLFKRDGAMQNLTDFIKSVPDAQVWGNGISFDLGMLDDDLRAIGNGETPWNFRKERDVRTVVEMCERITGKHPKLGVPLRYHGLAHNPHWDTLYELDLMHSAVNMMAPSSSLNMQAWGRATRIEVAPPPVIWDPKMLTDGFNLPEITPPKPELTTLGVSFTFAITPDLAKAFIDTMNVGGAYNYTLDNKHGLSVIKDDSDNLYFIASPWDTDKIQPDFNRARDLYFPIQHEGDTGPNIKFTGADNVAPSPNAGISVDGLTDDIIERLNSVGKCSYVIRPRYAKADVTYHGYVDGYGLQFKAPAWFDVDSVKRDFEKVLGPQTRDESDLTNILFAWSGLGVPAYNFKRFSNPSIGTPMAKPVITVAFDFELSEDLRKSFVDELNKSGNCFYQLSDTTKPGIRLEKIGNKYDITIRSPHHEDLVVQDFFRAVKVLP